MTTLPAGSQVEGLPVDPYDVVPKVYVDDADAVLSTEIDAAVVDHEGEETVDGGTGPVVTVRAGVRSAFISWSGLEVVVSGHGYYEVEYDISDVFSAPLESVQTKSTWMTFDGLATGVAYYFRVRAVDASGNTSGWTVSPPTATAEEVDTGDIADDAVTTAKILDGAVLAAKIADGTLTYTEFASGIEPVRLYTGPGLPTLPDAEYPEGAVVFWTNDGKLYRNVADSWTASTAATDITGQITETQITDNAITTGKIAAGAVTATEILADTITAGQIAAGAINTSELATDAVTADKILAGTITAASGIIADLAVNTLTSGNLGADVLIGGGEISALGANGEVLMDSAGIRMWANATRTGTPTVNLQASDGSATFEGTITANAGELVNLDVTGILDITTGEVRSIYEEATTDYLLEIDNEGRILMGASKDKDGVYDTIGSIYSALEHLGGVVIEKGLRILAGPPDQYRFWGSLVTVPHIQMSEDRAEMRYFTPGGSSSSQAYLSLISGDATIFGYDRVSIETSSFGTSPDILFLLDGGTFYWEPITTAATGVALRTANNPASGDPIFEVQSSGLAVRLQVDHDGETTVDSLAINSGGTVTVNGVDVLSQEACFVRRTSAQTITNSTWTQCTTNTTLQSTGTLMSRSTSGIRVRGDLQPGWYAFFATIRFTGASGQRIIIRCNNQIELGRHAVTGTSSTELISTSFMRYITTDAVQGIEAWQGSGASQTVQLYYFSGHLVNGRA